MGDKSKIEWTEATWNPTVGCSVVSPGCTNCYAMKMAARLEAMATADRPRWTPAHRNGQMLAHYVGTTKRVNGNAVWTGKLALAPNDILLKPLRWKRPRRIFVNSMSDLFHENVPDEWIDKVFATMALAPQHTFQVLTKRAERMREYVSRAKARVTMATMSAAPIGFDVSYLGITIMPGANMKQWPLPNVWLGVSAEDQKRADERIPHLLATPSAVRFISAEPLLGPIDLTNLDHLGSLRHDSVHGISAIWKGNAIGRACLDWVIVGGESGPNARPMHPDWARSIRDQCQAAGVPFFFKQWGEWKEAFHDEDGPKVNEVDNESDETEALLAALDGKPGWLHRDGRSFARRDYLPMEEPVRLMERIGKRAAGRLLDGREHNEMPERA